MTFHRARRGGEIVCLPLRRIAAPPHHRIEIYTLLHGKHAENGDRIFLNGFDP